MLDFRISEMLYKASINIIQPFQWCNVMEKKWKLNNEELILSIIKKDQ